MRHSHIQHKSLIANDIHHLNSWRKSLIINDIHHLYA